jgi:tetratricopeptide (TPR) repeat protein
MVKRIRLRIVDMSDLRKFVLVFLILLAANLVAYANTFHNAFQFDDLDVIDRLKETYLGRLNLGYLLTSLNIKDQAFIYRPAACLSLALNFHLSGAKVVSYHIFNLFFHFLAACVLFLFLYETFSRYSAVEFIRERAFLMASLGSLLWSLHPIQTQAVTYIIQRMAILAGLFSIASLYFYLLFKKNRRQIFLVCMGLCMAAAFGSKENTVLLPLLILVYEWLFFQKGSLAFICRRKALMGMCLAIFTVAVAGAILRGPGVLGKSLERFNQDKMPGRDYSLKERLLTEQRVVLYYLSLIAYPSLERLNVDHDFEISKSWVSPSTTLISSVAIAGLLLLAWRMRKRFPFLAWTICWYFSMLLIESSIFNLEIIFEHRAYLPSMMVLPLMGVGILSLEKLSVLKRAPYLPGCLLIGYILVLGHTTFLRNFVWRNPITLWSDCMRKSPWKARSYINLGTAISDRGRTQDGLALFRRALEIDPDNFYAHYNLGNEYMKLKAYDDALFHFKQASRSKPESSLAFNKLGVVYLHLNDLPRSKSNLAKAIELNESNDEAKNNLALVYYHEGRYHDAILLLKAVLEKLEEKEGLDKVQFNLGLLYKKLRDYDSAAFWIEKALQRSNSFLRKIHLIEVYQLGLREQKAAAMFNSLLGDLKSKGLTKEDLWQHHLEPLEKETITSHYASPVSELDYFYWRRVLEQTP